MANVIAGDIKCKKESVAHIEGAWDGEIYISEKINISLLKHRHWLMKDCVVISREEYDFKFVNVAPPLKLLCL